MNLASLKQILNMTNVEKTDNYFKFQSVKTLNTLEVKQKRILAFLLKKVAKLQDFVELKVQILLFLLSHYHP